MSRHWNAEPQPEPLLGVAAVPGETRSVRCLLDRDRPRPVDGPRSQVCSSHRGQLADMLDPKQTGQVYSAPTERRTPASIPVLYQLLPYEPGRSGDKVGGSVFRSTPPGDLTAAVLRDHRSQTGGTGRDDHDHDAALSTLGTLAAIAQRLNIRDIENRAVPWPHTVPELAAWLHNRLDNLCEADWIEDADHDLRRLHRQLRTAAGDPAPRPIGRCRKRVDDNGNLAVDPDGRYNPAGPWECGVQLYLPPQPLKGMDEPVQLPRQLHCRACGGTYTAHEIVALGVAERKAVGA